MVSLISLWLPIVVSAVVVWLVSWAVWALMPWHRSDYAGLPDEESAREAMKAAPPGAYSIPNMADRKALSTEEYQGKLKAGPVGFVYLGRPGMPNMGAQLAQWLLFLLVVSVCIAYVCSLTLPAGIHYMRVFRVVATVAWLGYGFAQVTESIWFYRPWKLTVKHLVDALIYALFTAGVFGWLWPAA